MLMLGRSNSPAPSSLKVALNHIFGALGRPLSSTISQSLATGQLSFPKAETFTPKTRNIREIIDLPLPPLNKSHVSYPQESSKSNLNYHDIVFRFTPLQLAAAQPIAQRAHNAIEYLADSGFEWVDIGSIDTAYLERDVSKRNEMMVIPLLVQLGNSLCPEGYAVAHFTQASQLSGRIDHVLTLHRLTEPLTASQLQNQDPDAIFERPKRWSILGQEEAGSVQALLGIEDKLTITPTIWDESRESDSKIGDLDSEEVKKYTSQILKYARLFRHKYVTLNDGNSYITFHIDRTDLESLANAGDDAMPHQINAKYIIYGPENVRRGLFLALFAGLEDAFGTFTGSGWENGGKIRGPVSFVREVESE